MSDPAFLVITSADPVGDSTIEAIGAALAASGCSGGVPLRLGRCGVEFGLDDLRPEAAVLGRFRAQFGVDCNLVPAGQRRKKLLIADMDSTIISVECIDELADFAGVRAQVEEITEAAMKGELDFEGALLARVALLEGLPVEKLAQCYEDRVRLNPGARAMVQTVAALGAQTALVSGGFTHFSERVAGAAGFASHQANTLLAENGRLTGDVGRPILGRSAKLEAMRRACESLSIGFEDVLAVGDGANDLDMVAAAGLGVAYHAKPALKDGAAAVLEHSDLTALLYLQGIPESEWSG